MNRLLYTAIALSLVSSMVLADELGSKIEICIPEELNDTCVEHLGKNDAALQTQIHACLTKLFACREYQLMAGTLLEAIDRNQAALPPVQQYFLGAALYRLHLQSRSNAVRCKFRADALDQLKEFLLEVRVKFNEVGNAGNINLTYVRHATSMMSALEKVRSCSDSAMSISAARHLAKKKAFEKIEQDFLNVKIGEIDTHSAQGMISDMMNQIFTMLQQFITKSSELEIGSKMLETEIVGYEHRMSNIKNECKSLYTVGDLSADEAVCKDQFSESSKMDAANSLTADFERDAAEMTGAKEKVITDGTSDETYKKLRAKYSGRAFYWGNEATFQQNLYMRTLRGQPLTNLQNSTTSLSDDNDLVENLFDLRQKFYEENFECEYWDAWYCVAP